MYSLMAAAGADAAVIRASAQHPSTSIGSTAAPLLHPSRLGVAPRAACTANTKLMHHERSTDAAVWETRWFGRVTRLYDGALCVRVPGAPLLP